MKLLVLTVSDRASQGIYGDGSGPAILEILSKQFPEAVIQRTIVSDDPEDIENAFKRNATADIILTTGGTGIGPRDNTADVTTTWCDRLIPGIAEYLRMESSKETTNATLSRGVAGIKGSTIIVNLPGSVKGAVFCTNLLLPILPHALKMLHGEGH